MSKPLLGYRKNFVKKIEYKRRMSHWMHQLGETYFHRIHLDIRLLIRSVLHGVLEDEFHETDNPTHT
jgi:hypothetical protein